MRGNYRKILMSISTFLFALFAFTGATLAWFELSDQVSIGGFDMEITSGENLKIEIAPGVYSNGSESTGNPKILFPALFYSQKGYTVNRVRLEPLTSLDGKTFYIRQLGTTYLDDNYLHVPDGQYLNYFDFNLKFKSESSTSLMNVHLNTGTRVSNFHGDPIIPNTVRIAFIVDDVTIMIYEEDALVQPSNSFKPGYGLDGIQLTSSAKYDGSLEGALNSLLFTIGPNETQTMTIRIWLEGWDHQTNDDFWKVTSVVKTFLRFRGIPQE